MKINRFSSKLNLKVYVLFLFFILIKVNATFSQESLTKYVKPRIGTAHCRWFHFAPGAVPFGMAKPGPATNAHLGNKSGWEATGYDYRDTSIEGFPCFHEFQVGGIVLMPTTGELITKPGDLDKVEEGYRSSFSHDNEFVTAGYYSVKLDDYDIKVELTATKRVAYQRYSFPESKEKHIIFNIGNQQGESGKVVDSKVKYNADGTVQGYVITEPEYVKKYQSGASIKMFFYAELDKLPDSFGTFNKDKIFSNSKSLDKKGVGAYFTYNSNKADTITVKIGLSYTSIDNAKMNLLAESKNLSFDEAKKSAVSAWESALAKIKVEGKSTENKIKFYTSLYHALLGRGLASDINGAYPKHDGTIGQIPIVDGKPKYSLYNSDAIWGAQWNLIQLWALAYPEYLSDYISSHLLVYQDSGWLADGIACSRYVSGVGTNLLSLPICAAFQCGIRDFDIDLAYQACLKNELVGKDRPFGAGKVDVDKFVKFGFVPHLENGTGSDEAFMFSASHTLEYSYSSWAVAQFAKSLSHVDDYNKLMFLSKGWERIYDHKLNFIRPKYEDGNFISSFNPLQVWRGFQEGNSWQYTFYVPHDAPKLIKFMGQKEFNVRLDSIFTASEKLLFSGGRSVNAFAGLETLYNQGNQPCLHIPWLFNLSNQPSSTQKWVRRILDQFYGIEGIHGYGYGQDEDQGQLGAWYVLSSMGLFDVKGLTSIYPKMSLSTPLFDKVTIKLNPQYYTNNKFVISTTKTGGNNSYIHKIELNNQRLHNVEVPFSSIVAGGKLNLELGDTPCDKY